MWALAPPENTKLPNVSMTRGWQPAHVAIELAPACAGVAGGTSWQVPQLAVPCDVQAGVAEP